MPGAMGLSEPETLPKLQLAKKETAMKLIAKRVHRFLVCEDGPTAVEYAVMLVLVFMVCLVAIGTVGDTTSQSFTDSSNSIAGS